MSTPTSTGDSGSREQVAARQATRSARGVRARFRGLAADVGTPRSGGTWPVLVSSAVLFAIIGVIVAGVVGRAYSATTLVDAGPGATVEAALDMSSDPSNRYVQTELLYVSIDQPQMDAAVRAQTGIENSSSVGAAQQPGTTIIALTGTARGAEDAIQVTNISAQAYVSEWRARSIGDVDREIAAINAAVKGSPGIAARVSPRLADLEVSKATIATAQRIIEPASNNTVARSANVYSGFLVGGLFGLLVGLVLLLIGRRRHADDANRAS